MGKGGGLFLCELGFHILVSCCHQQWHCAVFAVSPGKPGEPVPSPAEEKDGKKPLNPEGAAQTGWTRSHALLFPQATPKINSRWTTDEQLLAVQGKMSLDSV